MYTERKNIWLFVNYHLKIILSGMLLVIMFACTFDDEGGSSTPTDTPTNIYIPHSPRPEDESINQENLLTLSWQVVTADSYTVYLDTQNPPQKIARRGLRTKSLSVFAPGASQTYYWKVLAHFSDGSTTTSPVWKFTTSITGVTEPGYIMYRHSLTTAPPNLVNILFQVVDINEDGVDNLTVNDFRIYEDGDIVSNLESSLKITKREDNDYKFKTVLMLDNSSSISGTPSNNLDDVKQAAKNFVLSMHDQQQIAVYEFSSDTKKVIGFTPKTGQSQIIAAINGIGPGARSTDLYGAVINGAQLLNESFNADSIVQSAMVLFTDGDDTQGSHTLENALDAIVGKIVFTVGLGPDIDSEVLNLLGTSGAYFVNEISQVTQAFVEIQRKIDLLANSFYWMEYASPKRGKMEHLLQLHINGNPISSIIEGTYSSAGFFDGVPGIYFNSSFLDPQGTDEIPLISGGDPVEVKVSTYEGTQEPFYTWENEPLLIRQNLTNNRSHVSIQAIAGLAIDTTVTITVQDVYNGFTKDIKFNIFRQ